jgi:uncharacterized protein (DUF433 family)
MSENAEPGWRSRVSVDAAVCHGKPCIRGTRIMVSLILDYLTAGESTDDLRRQYPQLVDEDVRAALGYAAWLARQEEEHPLHSGTSG